MLLTLNGNSEHVPTWYGYRLLLERKKIEFEADVDVNECHTQIE